MTGRPPPRPSGPPGPPRPILVPGQVPVRGAIPARPVRPPPPPVGALRQMMPRGPAPLGRPPLGPPGVRLPPPGPPVSRPTAPAPRPTPPMVPAARPRPPMAPVVRPVAQMVPPVRVPAVRPSIQEPIASSSFATGPLQQSLPSVENVPMELESGPLTYQGTGGSSAQVTANFLRLSVKDSTEVSEYEVQFTPQVDSRDERFRLLAEILPKEFGRHKVFDGVKLFLPQPLDPLTQEFPAKLSSGSAVKVKLLYKRRFNFKDRDAVQLFNILFNRIMRTLKLIQHKRNFYNPAATTNIPSCNLQVWPGYVTAIDLYEGGILLQCDVSHRILRTDTALQVFSNLRKNRDSGKFMDEAKKFFIGTSVLTRYNNKTYIIDEIDFDLSPMSTFVQANGQEVSFVDYYKTQYNTVINDKNQPMLVHRPKKKFKRGDKTEGEDDPERVILLVPELCLLTGMTDEMRSDFKIMRELSGVTRQNPSKRQTEVREFVRTVLNNPEALAHLTTWGIGLTDEPLPVPARMLPAEKLNFGNNYVETVNPKGDWTRAATSQKVLTAIHIRKWVVFFPANCEADVRRFCMLLSKNASKMGIEIAQPKWEALPNDRTETFITEMKKVVEPGVQIVMTVFPQLRGDRYSAVKKLCCIDNPIASQCILLKTIKGDDRKTNSVAQKVALQINCKLGGELWSAPLPIKTVMVIGIDVWHSKTQDSIAGVVASFNETLTRYYSETSVQKKNEEVFIRLSNPIRHAFAAYYNNNNFKFPEHVVVFRDGVGDGQLSVVEQNEARRLMSILHEMVKALNERNEKRDEAAAKSDEFMLGPPDLPPLKVPSLVYVVVQKRINTRIYKYTVGTNNYENPPPGTIVDSTITRYQYKDFFLVPQSVNQGTVSPTHFVVVKEYGNHLKPDHIQKLAYKLTHMYYNWPGTVRVPAPCQYAHKLVDLVGENLRAPVTNAELNRRLFYL